MKKIIGIFALTCLSVTAATAQELTFDLMHTTPNCNYTGFQPTFCHGQDSFKMDEAAGMSKRIKAQLDRALANPESSSVNIAFFSMSNKIVQGKLCELIKKNVKVNIVLDQGSAGNISQMKSLPECAGASFKSLNVNFMGGLVSGSVWRLHHNKFLYVDPGNGQPLNLNFSSGNLSAFGTSVHLDHWVTMTAPKSSNLVKSYDCVIKGLAAATNTINSNGGSHTASNDNKVVNAYLDTRDKCFGDSGVLPLTVNGREEALKKEGIVMLYSPNTDDSVYAALKYEIERVPKGGYIYIGIQHFLHSGVASDLIDASNSGVDVRIVMDNDVVTGQSEVQGVTEFLSFLKQSGPKLKIRYIESNHLAGGNGSMMHNKFAIFNGQRILSGAGHYTSAAMSDNWENFGLTEVPSLTKQYAQYFKELWDLSVDEAYVKNQLPFGENHTTPHKQPLIKTPEALSSSLLQLIEK
jgi:hypothetical protein